MQFQTLIHIFESRIRETRDRNKAFSAEELRLGRAKAILEKVGDICDCRHRCYRQAVIDHIESLAHEIGGTSVSDHISAVAINPLVLFIQNCKFAE